LYRVTPWPVRSAIRCRDPEMNVCYSMRDVRGRSTDADLHAHLVASVSDGRIDGVAAIPAGVVAAAETSTGPRALLVRWIGERRQVSTIVLPQPAIGTITTCSFYGGDPFVKWPWIVIPACP